MLTDRLKKSFPVERVLIFCAREGMISYLDKTCKIYWRFYRNEHFQIVAQEDEVTIDTNTSYDFLSLSRDDIFIHNQGFIDWYNQDHKWLLCYQWIREMSKC